MVKVNGWQGWALALVTGILLGVITTGAIGSWQVYQSEARIAATHKEDIEEVKAEIAATEVDGDKTFDMMIEVLQRLKRIETLLEKQNGSNSSNPR